MTYCISPKTYRKQPDKRCRRIKPQYGRLALRVIQSHGFQRRCSLHLDGYVAHAQQAHQWLDGAQRDDLVLVFRVVVHDGGYCGG